MADTTPASVSATPPAEAGTTDAPEAGAAPPADVVPPKAAAETEAGEEEECGFCVFMKGGGCKDQFEAWSKCVDDHRTAGEDFAAACHPATAALQACMGEHSEYYRDFLADADALAADAALATGAGVGGEGEEEGAADGGGDDDDVAVLADPAAPASAAAAAAAEAGVAAASSLDPPPSPATAAAAAAAALVDAAVADASSSPAISLATPPGDARFPATNQARRCFTAYSEHAKCVAAGGEEGAEERCGGLARAYRSLCPSEWVEKWADQRAAGTWAGKY